MVTNDGPWDIKRKEQWRIQMGSVEWGSSIFPFVFNEMIKNPEILGNITYGYWGKCAGFSTIELLAGGDVASLEVNKRLDSSDDKITIMKGVKMYISF